MHCRGVVKYPCIFFIFLIKLFANSILFCTFVMSEKHNAHTYQTSGRCLTINLYTKMSKFITKQEISGYDFNDFDHRYFFDILNEKDENGYNGRYVSSWYYNNAGRFDTNERKAITDMIWYLTLNFFKGHAYNYEKGHMSQLRLSDVTEYVANKMNTWSGEIKCWLKGMELGNAYDLDVCDHWGLDTITIFINK